MTFATQTILRSVLRTDDTPSIVVIDLQAIFKISHTQRASLSYKAEDLSNPIR
jgi:hypothetical protein